MYGSLRSMRLEYRATRDPSGFHWRSPKKIFHGSTTVRTPEALGVLLAPKLKNGEKPQEHALNKLMTSRYPASAILMEVSICLKKVGFKALVEWAPREGN